MTRGFLFCTLLCALAVLLPGCAGKERLRVPRVDPEATVMAFRETEPAQTLQARFRLKVDGPRVDGATGAALVLNRPDQLRLDVNTPLGTPLLILATDGKELDAWLQRDATFFRGDDALAVLAELTGGVVDVEDLIDILTGQLPLDDATLLVARTVPGGVEAILGKEDVPGYRIRALLEPRQKIVSELVVARAAGEDPTALGETLMTVRILDATRTQQRYLPEELEIELPTLGWTVHMEFRSWEEPEAVPDVFSLSKPGNAREKDLVETLRQMAAQRGLSGPE